MSDSENNQQYTAQIIVKQMMANHQKHFLLIKNNQEQTNNVNKINKHPCAHNVANCGAISMPGEHRQLIDVLLGRPTIDGRYEAVVPSELVKLKIDKSDLDCIFEQFTESRSKPTDSLSIDTPVRKQNTKWIEIIERYVEKVNETCVFMYKSHHYSRSKSSKLPTGKEFLMSADAKCTFSSCQCCFHAVLSAEGDLTFNFSGHIAHSPSECRS